MKFKLYRNFGALNSVPIFDAFRQGILNTGHEITESDDGIPVIWSVLWSGRMAGNQNIYYRSITSGKPIIIIEIGNLKRGVTWRIGQNHINNLGKFGNFEDLDLNRPNKLGVALSPLKLSRRDEILIAGQHSKSLQWESQPLMDQWIRDTIKQIRQYSNRKIIIRPHPRSPILSTFKEAVIELPKKIQNTYDDFDISYNFHCVINHNSGPAVQAAINGTPVICDPSSLAFPVSEKWENLEHSKLPDREEWFVRLCHTEWTVDEIAQGIPLQRLLKTLS